MLSTPEMTEANRYETLSAAFEEQLAKTARFVPAAFHVHSPNSHDWGKGGSITEGDPSKLDGDASLDAYLNALVAAGLRLVCVTDHMKAGYAAALSERSKGRDDITVLPGMEVSCLIPPGHSERVHLLLTFPEGTSADVIERVFATQKNLEGAGKRTGEEVATIDSLTDWRKLVGDQGGMFFLAHVDQHPRGHRAYVRRVRGETLEMFVGDDEGAEATRKISHEYAEHLVDLAPDAIEVMKSEDREHYLGFKTKDGHTHGFACLARSDHHDVSSFSDLDAITHVKLSKVDFECLHRALLFHQTRIRFSDDLPPTPTPRLVGLRLTSSSGLFAGATVAFNENLNTLIGPRGSGKSTLVEALRYVLGQRPSLQEEGKAGGEEGSFAGLAIATQDANLRDAEIELIYEIDGERHLLTATFDAEQGVTTRAFLPDGSDRHIETDALASVYPARIFSWSELETLGRNPRLQRLVVDRLTDDLTALDEQVGAARGALVDNRERATALRRKLDELFEAEGGSLRRYTEFELNFKRLNTPEVEALFHELDILRERISVVTSLEAELTKLAGALSDLTPDEPADALAGLLDGGSAELRAYWEGEVAPKLKLGSLADDIRTQVDAAIAGVADRREVLAEQLRVQRGIEEEKEAEVRAKTDAHPESHVQTDQRESARVRFERADGLRRSYIETFDQLAEVLSERVGLVNQVEEVAHKIAAARQATAAKLGDRLTEIERPGEPKVTIAVEPAADRDGLTEYLDSELLNLERGGHYHQRGLAPRLAKLSPAAIAKAIVERDSAALTGGGRLDQDEAEKLVAAFDLLEQDDAAQVTHVGEELIELLSLQEVPVHDLVKILSDGTSVDRLSPGGRSSAMLPLIALSDSAPLIIDQPEDNLDNRMVGQTLSSILAELKERRQIIVTTHNPNIVVGGDAEQVIVLNAPTADSAEVKLTGSIDDDDVIDAVIRIMEGGKEAFEARERRYESHLRPDG